MEEEGSFVTPRSQDHKHSQVEILKSRTQNSNARRGEV